MDLRNVPYRSDVLTWDPDDLAEYFRTLKYKDCEKVVRKHSINGQRFLSVSVISSECSSSSEASQQIRRMLSTEQAQQLLTSAQNLFKLLNYLAIV